MDRKKASDFPQELLNLFDDYVHGDMSRRAFLDGAQKFAVGGVTRATLFEMLKPNYAWAIQVPKDDKRHQDEDGHGAVAAGQRQHQGLSRAARERRDKLPAVLVVHENRGLNPYIEDVARRLAIANFMAFAPDGLTSVGGYPGDDEKGAALFGQVDRGQDAARISSPRLLAERRVRTAPASSARSASASAAASSTRWRCAWAPISPPRCRSTARSRAPPTPRRSRRRSSRITASSTRASPAAGRRTTRR